jgi:hypothetical protein
MKYLLIAAILLRLPAMAQETATPACKLIKETDPYTKETRLSTGFIFFDGGSVTIDADSTEIIVLFSIEGPDRCFDNNTNADLYFEGIKSKTMGRNAGTMNCEGLFQLVFKNSHSTPTTVLQRLLTKKTTQIIFNSNTKKPITVTIGPKEQEGLMALANCLVTEAKTLIK